MISARPRADRRATRSKTALHRALMSLMLERRYDAITVKAICAAADVGRSTFYEHYAGKDDLKRDGLERMRHELTEQAANDRETKLLAFTRPMFDHAREHLEHYRSLAGSRAGAVVLERIRQTIGGLVRRELGSASADSEIAVQYVVGAYMSVLTWWLDDGAKQAPASIDSAFRRLVSSGMHR
jgi:AcrR family transcriptional regulator